jgi:hypothetical protein
VGPAAYCQAEPRSAASSLSSHCCHLHPLGVSVGPGLLSKMYQVKKEFMWSAGVF